jgi:prepilin-type N-terminal cleavage/methylation domain-containing protein
MSRTRRGSRLNVRSLERGMTMVELMMALVVLSIGLLGLAAIFPAGRRFTNRDRLMTTATDLAEQKMEQLRTLSYSDPDLTIGTHPTASGETVGNNNRFVRWWTITQIATDLRCADVRVTWAAVRPETARVLTYFKR